MNLIAENFARIILPSKCRDLPPLGIYRESTQVARGLTLCFADTLERRLCPVCCACWTVNDIPYFRAENEGPLSPSRMESSTVEPQNYREQRASCQRPCLCGAKMQPASKESVGCSLQSPRIFLILFFLFTHHAN